MYALGRLFNVLPVADDVYVSMKNCGGITFVGVLTTGDTWTLTEAKDAAGTSSQVLATITEFHTSVTVGSAWVKGTQAAGSAVTTSSAQDVIVIEVDAAEMSDTYTHLKLTSTSTGIVIALQRDLTVQRKPANLTALV
jgi:hypothetical protein